MRCLHPLASRSLSAILTLATLGLVGCDCDPSDPPARCTSSTECATGQTCTDGRCVTRGDGGPDTADTGSSPIDAPFATTTGLVVTPGAPEIVCTDGAASVDLDVALVYSDGTTRATTGFWSADHPVLGAVDRDSGVFTATCEVAGAVTVTVEAGGLTTTTTVNVRIERTLLIDGASPDDAAHFGGVASSDPAQEIALAYPLEGTVFPQNVHAADLQWSAGAAGDVYRVRAETRGVRIDAILAHPPGFGLHWQPDATTWRALAESAPETPVTFTIDRWVSASGTLVAGATRTTRFANATIRGSIYYWDLEAGEILRIAGDGTGLETFMPRPPASPTTGSRCVACHAVSRDGTRMAAEVWGGGEFGAIFDLTADLSTDPAPTIVAPNVVRFLTATFSPDNSRLVANNGSELFLIDGNTGARLPAGGAGLPATGSANPTWSPNGAQVAFVSNTDGSWAVDYSRGDLSILDVDPLTPDTFSAPRTILSDPTRVAARPSWTPDSRWIAFQHGQFSRAFQDLGSHSVRRDATIRMTSSDGATTFDLEALNVGGTYSYYPTFSPFDEGGYFWLAFFSTRDYGNAHVGTAGTGRRQLWVAAIDSSPTAGTDPSHAPYWIPQQNVNDQNMAAFWAPEACRADGRTCATSGECCSGFCREGMCVPPDEVECSHEGESCRSDDDCCESEGTSCSANTCSSIG